MKRLNPLVLGLLTNLCFLLGSVPAADPLPLPISGGKLEAAEAAVLTLPPTLKVAPGTIGELKAETTGKKVRWKVHTPGLDVKDPLGTGKLLYVTGLPGTYTLDAWTAVGDEPSDASVCEITVTGVGPTPVPPTPVPPTPVPPAPGPTGKVSYFVVVEDTSKAGAWRGDVLGSAKVEAFYKTLRGARAGAVHRLIDINTDGDDQPALAFKKLAQGKDLPYIWLLDEAGKVLKEGKCPVTPDEFVAFFPVAVNGEVVDEHPRAMGLIPAAPKLKWAEFGSTPSTPVIPRANWKPVSLETFLPPVHDQDGRGQCNASATCTAIEAARNQAGLPYVYLSAGDLYSQINGGRDNGSTLEDGLDAAVRTGVSTTATVPYVWDGRNHSGQQAVKDERKLYRVTEAYLCPNFDAVASALQQGYFIVEGLMWYNNFTPDRDGWLPATGRGLAGGHALCGYGLAERNGKWGIMTRNSWGSRWGVGGNCIIPESLFDPRGVGGYWAVRAVVQTPTPFPSPRAFRFSPGEKPATAWADPAEYRRKVSAFFPLAW